MEVTHSPSTEETSQPPAPDSHATHPITTPIPRNFNLNALPPELRYIVFEFCDLSWRPRYAADADPERHTAMLAIIVALRSQENPRGPYFEALKLFYRQNTYDVGSGNGYGFGWMLPSAISTIQSVSIAFASFAPAFRPSAATVVGFEYVAPNFQLLPIARLNPDIREIRLYHDCTWVLSRDQVELDLLQRRFPKCPSSFTGLKRVSLEFFDNMQQLETISNPTRAYSSRSHRKMNIYGTQVSGQTVLRSCEQRGPFPTAGVLHYYWLKTWEWTAPEGREMHWSEWTLGEFFRIDRLHRAAGNSAT